MPLKDNEGKLGKAFKDPKGEKPAVSNPPSQKFSIYADGRVEETTRKAPSGPIENPPATPNVAPALRPKGPIVQEVHTEVERAKQQVSPQLRDDQKTAEFKKKMLVKQEFNRAAKDRTNRDRDR